MKILHYLVVRDKPALLSAMMQALAGNAHISFEGNLSDCQFPPELVPFDEAKSLLPRNTIFPKKDFTILSLELQTVRPILDVILPKQRYMKDINHIQIEKEGKLEFSSCDQFDPECTVCGEAIPGALLASLADKGILHSWGEVKGLDNSGAG